MKIKQYWEELKLDYPIADRLNKGCHEIATYIGTQNKIDACLEIACGLGTKFSQAKDMNKWGDKYFHTIDCNFTAEPYFDKSAFVIKYRYVLLIYTAILHADFDKKGFYHRMLYKYTVENINVIVEEKSKKQIPELDGAVLGLDNIVRCFLNDSLEI